MHCKIFFVQQVHRRLILRTENLTVIVNLFPGRHQSTAVFIATLNN